VSATAEPLRARASLSLLSATVAAPARTMMSPLSCVIAALVVSPIAQPKRDMAKVFIQVLLIISVFLLVFVERWQFISFRCRFFDVAQGGDI